MTANQLDTGHSEVGPSSLSAIIACPGRVRMCRGLEDKTSFAAAEGTVAHWVAENTLLDKSSFENNPIVEQDGHHITVDQEMLDAVQVYLDHIDELHEAVAPSVSVWGVELKGDLSHIDIPEVFGTCDYSLSIPFQTLYVRDYKHGTGILVDPEDNPQLMAYALIAGQDMISTYETIDLGIVQPRAKSGEKIKTWQTTPEHLIEWAESNLAPAVKLALTDDAPLVPGEDQCRWCRAKDICPALATKALQVAQEDFKDFADIRPDEMVESVPIEKVAQVYEKLPLLKEFIKAVEGRMFAELSAGSDVPGWKLAAGRRSRSWKDEVVAQDFLEGKGFDPYEYKLLSPAKAEKALGKAKKEVSGLIEVSEGKPVIVPENDKRPAISVAANDFKNYA